MITEQRIRDWVEEFGEAKVYISFSGGKDSTVLLHLVRGLFPNIPAVFVDTGLEYPEIREFVNTFDNVFTLTPKMNFRQVINKYGYPFISKDISGCIYYSRKYLRGETEKENIRFKQVMGTALKKDGRPSNFNYSRYKFLLKAPFEVSNKCCDIMKKRPIALYQKETGRYPITGQMTCESRRRELQWLKTGCNSFNGRKKISNPMSFWLEQDVLQYIKINKLKICSVYGDIKVKHNLLYTTGCNRTGCMFCGYGCHLEKENGRFLQIKDTHPKIYDFIMRPKEKGGLNYKEVIDYINEKGNFNIKY